MNALRKVDVMLRFKVENQKLALFSKNKVIADSRLYLHCKFEFSHDWDGCVKTAQIMRTDSEEPPYEIDLIDNEIIGIRFPTPVLESEGTFTISLHGSNAATGTFITTNDTIIPIYPSGYVEGVTPVPAFIPPDTYVKTVDGAGGVFRIEVIDGSLKFYNGTEYLEVPGRVELRSYEGEVQWKYAESAVWTDLISVLDLSGATFIPSISDGVLSWTNNQGLENPAPLYIVGQKGDKGDKGDTGLQGLPGTDGQNGLTPNFIIGDVVTGLPGTDVNVEISGAAPNYELEFTIPRGEKGPAGDGTGDMTASVYDPTGKSQDIFAYSDSKAYTHPLKHSADIIEDGTTNKAYTATEKTKLSGIAIGAEVNVNPDWNAVSGKEQILNKPDVYTKTEVNNIVSAVYKYKGSVANYAALPSVSLTIGDVYNCLDTGINYAWDGTGWDDIGGVEELATASNNGLISKEDFAKLLNIDANANNYVHPTSHSISEITDLSTTLNNKAAKAASVSATLTAAGWTGDSAPYSQTVTVSGITATNNAIMNLSPSVTQTQFEAGIVANLIVSAQAVNSITVTAFGAKPTVDVPIGVVILG